jgi:ABC-type uncharacterized transport system ATPase subunit
VIHVSGFRKTCGSTVAVDDVSFNVNSSAIVGLIGEDLALAFGRALMFAIVAFIVPIVPSRPIFVHQERRRRAYELECS